MPPSDGSPDGDETLARSHAEADKDTEWDASAYDDHFSFVSNYGESVVDLLDPRPDERVLDVGCGTGELTRVIADTDATVVGVDASAEMVDRARELHPDLQFVHGDARHLDEVADVFEDTFDAVFSNAALHWIPGPDHDAVLAGVADCLRPGGRFVAELGGSGNVARVVDAALDALAARGYEGENPWYFPSIGEYTPRVETHGFEVRDAHLFDRPTRLDGDDGLREWLSMFGDGLLAPVDGDERAAVVAAVEESLADEWFHDREREWTVDYRRLRFRAVRL